MTATQPPREPGLDLGIVVLSFGRGERHRELVDTLIATDRIAPSSIVVVHNAFAPGDEWLPIAPPGVRVLGTGDNLGYAGGMNLGIRTHLREGRRWVLCLTHEVRLGEGCLAALVAATRERDDLGVIGPVLFHAVTGEVFSSGVISTRWGVRHRMEVERGTQPVDRDAVDGSAMLVRAAAFEAVGGLDERMFMYWEETEFCLRVRQHGWRVAVATDARAFAEPGGASRTAAHAYLTTRNGLLYASSTRHRGAVPARLARTAYEIWRAIPKPGGRRSRDPAMWRIGAVRSTAAIWGVVDYARGRYGPPPPRLLRGTDIRPTIPAG